MGSQRIARWLLGLLLVASAGHGETLSGRVVGVSDGDTIMVLDAAEVQHKIRLAAIDAPENKQSFGNRSKQHLSDLLHNRPVCIEWKKHDRYGRIVGKVMISSLDASASFQETCPGTLDAGLVQIAAGLAWHYKQYEKEQTDEDRERYSFAENEAQAKRIGLWQDRNAMPPWEWRHQRR